MSRTELQESEFPEFRMALPAGWEQVESPGSPVELIAVERGDGEAFRANVVVTVEDISDVRQWLAVSGRALGEQLQDFVLLDEQPEAAAAEDTEEVGVRRLFHHFVPDGGSVTGEQWSWSAGQRGFTLTASAGTFEYDGMAELFASVARGFRIRTVGAGT